MKNKINYKLIGVLILIFGSLFLVLFLTSSRNDEVDNEPKPVEPRPEKPEVDKPDHIIIPDDKFDKDQVIINKLMRINDYSEFFTIANLVKYYLNSNLDNNKILYNIIDPEYIKDNQLNDSNIINQLYVKEYANEFTAKEMLKYNNGTIETYFVKGNVGSSGIHETKIIESKIFIIRKDNSTKSWNVSFTDNLNIEEVAKNYKYLNNKEHINKNKNNKIIENSISAVSVPYIYMADFANEVIHNTNKAYEYLSEETKKVYPTIEKFNEFIENNKEKFLNYKITFVKAEEDKNNTIFIVETEDLNFEFKTDYVMHYSVTIN